MANVKVFADEQIDARTNRQRDGPTLYAPDLSMRGHKNAHF